MPTPASITTSTTFSSLASPAESSDPLLPLYIVLGILGALVLIAGVVIAVIKLRDVPSRAAVADVPLQEADPPAPKIDRYADVNEVRQGNDELSRYADVVAVRRGNYEAPDDPL
jgi:hypothetical protein